jgi:hypothetical protein
MFAPRILFCGGVAVVMAKNRLSGAQRRGFARAIKSGAFFGLLRQGKAGRPKGMSERTEDRRRQLHKDLAWLGLKDASDMELVKRLQDKPAYKGISERTLRREIAVVQRLIWGPKMRGAKYLANNRSGQH